MLALQTLGFTPADLLYILTHSEQVDALNVAKASYLTAVQAAATQVLPPRP